MNPKNPRNSAGAPRGGLDYLRVARGMLRRQKRLMLGVFLLAAVPLVAYELWTAKPRYESSATILIEPSLVQQIPAFRDLVGKEVNVSVLVAILKSRSLAEAVLEAVPKESFDELITGAQYRDFSLELKNAVRGLLGKPPIVFSPRQRALVEIQRSRMKFEPRERTGIIEISGFASNPRVAMDMVNTYIQVLVSRTRSTNQEEARAAREFIEAQLKSLRENLSQAEEELTGFQQRHGKIKLAEQSEMDLGRLNRLENELAEVQANRQITETRLKAMREQLSKEPTAQEGKPASQAQEDLFVKLVRGKTLQDRLSQLEATYAAQKARYTENHPSLQATRREIENTREDLARLGIEGAAATESGRGAAPLARVDIQRRVVDLEAEASAHRPREESLALQVERLRKGLRNMSLEETEFSRLRRAVESNRNLVAILTDKLMGVRIREQGETGIIKIIDAASLPLQPSAGAKLKFMIMALFLGAALGGGAGFLVEFVNEPLETEGDVRSTTGLPVLGSVALMRRPGEAPPPSRRWGTRKERRRHRAAPLSARLPVVLHRTPGASGPVVELYRSIRASLEAEGLRTPFKTLLITSPAPGEGKTSTAINLALVFRELGRRVLLVAADLRVPGVGKGLRLPEGPGLAEYLAGKVDLQAIHTTAENGLAVIHGGKPPEAPGTLLSCGRAHELMGILSAEFDLVIFDSAPILAVSDNWLLSAWTDAVVLVVRAGETRVRDLRQARATLENAGARILGVIVNMARQRDIHYYHRRYRRYYAPKSPGTAPAVTHKRAGLLGMFSRN